MFIDKVFVLLFGSIDLCESDHMGGGGVRQGVVGGDYFGEG